MTTSISITRALATIKAIDAQINAYFGTERVLASIVLGEKKEPYDATMNLDALKKRIQSDHDGIDTLLRNRTLIKSAIIRSDAVNLVTLGNKTMTVAEAIVLKNALPIKEEVLKRYKNSFASVKKKLDDVQTKFEKRVNAITAASVSDSETDEHRASIVDGIRRQQEQLTAPTFFDPQGLVTKIETLTKEITDIKLELDYVLSESNTRTMIDVDM